MASFTPWNLDQPEGRYCGAGREKRPGEAATVAPFALEDRMHVMYVYKKPGALPVNIKVEYDADADKKPYNLRLSIPEHAEYALPPEILPKIVERVDKDYDIIFHPTPCVEAPQSTYGT